MLKAPLIAAAPPSARRVYQPLSSGEKQPIDKAISAGRLARLPAGEIYRRRQPTGRLAARGRLHHRHPRPHSAPAGHPVELRLVAV